MSPAIRDLNLSIAREVAARGVAHSESLTEALRETREQVQTWREIALVALLAGLAVGVAMGWCCS